jgi:hypothetical protein
MYWLFNSYFLFCYLFCKLPTLLHVPISPNLQKTILLLIINIFSFYNNKYSKVCRLQGLLYTFQFLLMIYNTEMGVGKKMLHSRSKLLGISYSISLALYQKIIKVFWQWGVHWLLSSTLHNTIHSFFLNHYCRKSLFFRSKSFLLHELIGTKIIQLGFCYMFIPIIKIIFFFW